MNTIGGYKCACSSGYSGDGYSCNLDDVNECANGTHNCDPYAICSNTQTGYDCKCRQGWEGNGMSCSKPYVAPAPQPAAQYQAPSSGYAYGVSAPAPQPAPYVAPAQPAYVAPSQPAPSGPSQYASGYAQQDANGGYITDDSYVGYMTDNSDAYNVVAAAYAENVAAYTPPAAPAYVAPAAPAYTAPAAPAYTAPAAPAYTAPAAPAYTAPAAPAYTASDVYGSGGSGSSTGHIACSDGITFCAAGATCTDTGAGIQCVCGAGYTGTGRLSEEDLQAKFEQEKARPPPGIGIYGPFQWAKDFWPSCQ